MFSYYLLLICPNERKGIGTSRMHQGKYSINLVTLFKIIIENIYENIKM